MSEHTLNEHQEKKAGLGGFKLPPSEGEFAGVA